MSRPRIEPAQVQARLNELKQRLIDQEAAKGDEKDWLLFTVFVADHEGNIIAQRRPTRPPRARTGRGAAGSTATATSTTTSAGRSVCPTVPSSRSRTSTAASG